MAASSATNVKNLGAALPELTVFGMMLGSGKEIVHFMRATRFAAISRPTSAKRLSKHLSRSSALRARHAAYEWERTRRPACQVRIRSGHPPLALLTGEGIDPRWRRCTGAVVRAGRRTIRVMARKRRGSRLRRNSRTMLTRRKELFPHAPSGQRALFATDLSATPVMVLRLAEAVGGRVDTSLPMPPPGCRSPMTTPPGWLAAV